MTATSSTQYIHPTIIDAEGFTQGNGTFGFKLKMGTHELVVFNNDDRDYLEPNEEVTAQDLVDALRKAANELVRHIRQEAN